MLISKFPMGVKIETGQVSYLAAAAVENTPGSINLTWTNPTGYKYFAGVMIRYKVGSYPTSISDGVLAYNGTGTALTLTGLTGGTNYYFRAFAKATNTSESKVFYNTDSAGAQVTSRTSAAPITNLVATHVADTYDKVTLTWTKPNGICDYVYIVRKLGSYPTSYTDGTVISTSSTATTVTDTGLAGATLYYYAAFTAWSGGNWNTDMSQRTTKTTICSPLTLSVTERTSSSITVAWSASPDPVRAIYLVRKAGGYPTSYTDGTQIYVAWNTAAGSVADSGLSPYTNYYYRAFIHNQENIWNSNTSQQIVTNTKIAAGQVVFTSSQNYYIPAGISLIDIFCVGGGGGASTSGGGGGYTNTWKNVLVTPGSLASVAIGSGGWGYKYQGQYVTPTDGSATTFSLGGVNYSANGGKSTLANGGSYDVGGAGGSGGGGQVFQTGMLVEAGDGGADGASGTNGLYYAYNSAAGGLIWNVYNYGGAGQGYTTRAFGESGNTLYAGGGGGQCLSDQVSANAGIGYAGAGGGGQGLRRYGSSGNLDYGGPGTPNTGGGAGGGGSAAGGDCYVGGSGVCIIRWAEQG